MWTPVKLILSNFISHEFTEFNYEKGFNLIQGINLDVDDSEESNGSGKSTLLQAEYFAIVGDPVRDVRQGDLISEGKKEGYVEIELFNTKLNLKLKIKKGLTFN